MCSLKTLCISILPFLIVFSGCDSSTAPDSPSCPDPITGIYDLITFEEALVPAWLHGKACMNFWCSDYSVRIVGGELVLSEDGTFEEVGYSHRNSTTDPDTLMSAGTYIVHENSIDFFFENSLFAGRYVGKCTTLGIELESPIFPFHWGGFGESARREWEKR